MSMKNSNSTIGNQTRDLPACSAVPQPTAVPGAPNTAVRNSNHALVYSFPYDPQQMCRILIWKPERDDN